MASIAPRVRGAAAVIAAAVLPACSTAGVPAPGLEDPAGAHDPTLIEQGGAFHVFTTGPGIQHLRSEDGRQWRRLAPALTEAPAWWAEAVPAHRGLDVWAPKVFALEGRYWLLYSISTFGKNRSAIGLASSAALDGPWQDEGMVARSVEGDDFNAIDPDLFIDAKEQGGDGRLWLSYGSFWGGIRVAAFDPETMRPSGPARFIARRKAGIEAPTMVRHGDWVYLFVSHDLCCRGTASTYNIRVGRSRSAQGPFLDQEGRDLMDGGGTLVEQGAGRWIGPGHQDVVGRWIVRHAYDGEDRGKPKLRLGELRWTGDGWPALASGER